jgi:hypothetical protein
MEEIQEKPDTFLEEFMQKMLQDKYKYIRFKINFTDEELNILGNEVNNVIFVSESF